MSSEARIGIIPLDNEMYWMDEFQFAQTTGSADRTIDGMMVVQQAQLTGGQPMTLTGEIGGWQSRATVQLLKQMERDPVNFTTPFEVIYQNTSYHCVFRHEEAPAVDFVPISPAFHPAETMWYSGTIKLRIIA